MKSCTLATRIVLQTSERAVFDAISFLACDPDLTPNPSITAVWTIEPDRGRYRICEPGKEGIEVFGVRSVVDHIHARLLSLSLQVKSQAAVLHAASLRRSDRRVLIAGRQSAGKTTLALRLLQAGYEFEGDEHVFVEHDGVIARPRACRVKEPALSLLADSAAAIKASPHYVDYSGRRIFNFDPRTIGGAWRIEKGRASAVVMVQPNHGGFSSIRPLTPLALSQALLSEYGLRESGRGASIGAIARLATISKGYDLSLGDHEGAIRCIDRVLQD